MSGGAYGDWSPQAAGERGHRAAPPIEAAEGLLAEILFDFQGISRREFRQGVLETMGRSPSSRLFHLDVKEADTAREHVREILRSIRCARDPRAVLGSLGEALRAHDPYDGALPWLELVVLALTADTGLAADVLLRVIGLLRALTPPPGPHQLLVHVPRNAPGRHRIDERTTLPEILGRLLDRFGGPDAGPALSFLDGLARDRELTLRHPQLHQLAALLGSVTPARPAPREEAPGRLIVQIRLEPETPEHIEASRYHLRASCYRQPLSGGPIERLNDLVAADSLALEDLVAEGSARLAGWQALFTELARSRRSPVRIEFLLPRSLLGHSAELWSPTPDGHRIGLLHPVVVRYLDRYVNPWLQTEAWYERWEQLFADTLDCEAADRIGWPPLHPERVADLPGWLDGRPTVACLCLDTPYDELDPRVRAAVLDAVELDGVPAMLWRRAPGAPTDVVEALRRDRPRSLAHLPEAVHRHRKVTRAAPAQDGVTLFWDDPNCMDPDQDAGFPGMV
ncbi:hypothetical protein [Streptomyces sp. CBMA123]|uniref:VMAP-C domain-containing protein n=1 Tax=Streptomyces sp. CBMA123 TaxID=1896313 RepID=UPI001661E969|nr:hypothetical protein [Streptomyces sp. CBMA123]MBD0695679.1 hypothetical protein [Streptomyces sp. CBMA123]